MSNKFTDVLPQPEHVSVGSGTIAFRGLSAKQIALLFSTYQDHAISFFGALGKAESDWAPFILSMPEMCHLLIAMSTGNADDPDQIEAIANLPLGVQAECMGAVYRLSVPDEKKFFAGLQILLQKLADAKSSREDVLKTSSSTPSQPGSTTSAGLATTSAK